MRRAGKTSISWILAALSLTAAPAWISTAASEEIGDEESRHEAAIVRLSELGAGVEVRQQDDGGSTVWITTDGLWEGKDAGLEALKDVRGLTKLRLGGKVTDAGLAHIGQLQELTALDVHVLGITDEGVRHLRHLTELRRLNLTYSQVTDKGLEYLMDMSELDWLGLSYTRVTAEGVDKLQTHLPDTVIQGNYKRRKQTDP